MKRLLGLALCAALIPTTALAQDKKDKEKKTSATLIEAPAPSFKHLDGLPFVVVADGSGGSTAAADALKQVAREDHVPLVIQSIGWCPYGKSSKDYADVACHFVGAARTVDFVLMVRKQCPRSPIILVGYSAGAHVTLVAAEMLPPGSVERVILLGAGVSTHYPLAGALKATRGGIDSYWSDTDGVLETAADCLGTADGQRGPCAGRVGFHVPRDLAEKDKALFAKFHQCQWREGMGGHGGHYTYVRESFVRRTLLPALLTTEVVEAPKAAR